MSSFEAWLRRRALVATAVLAIAIFAAIVVGILTGNGQPGEPLTSPRTGPSISFQQWIAQAERDCLALKTSSSNNTSAMVGRIFRDIAASRESTGRRADDLRRLADEVRSEVGPASDYPTDEAGRKRVTDMLSSLFAGADDLDDAANAIAADDPASAAGKLISAGSDLGQGAKNLRNAGALDCK